LLIFASWQGGADDTIAGLLSDLRHATGMEMEMEMEMEKIWTR
jgi:hypothetical protein